MIDQSHDHHIDRLVLIFPPRQPNRTSEISGTDLSVVDGITYPLLYATKVALHHFRRDFRDLKVPRRITVLADKRVYTISQFKRNRLICLQETTWNQEQLVSLPIVMMADFEATPCWDSGEVSIPDIKS